MTTGFPSGLREITGSGLGSGRVWKLLPEVDQHVMPARFLLPRSGVALRLLGLALPALLAGPGCGGGEEELTGSRCYGITAKVEQWRELVEKYFKKQHVTWALNIIQCESGGDPNAYNASSGASGLFQHLAKYWPERAAKAGFPGASPFNPEANIAASAYLLYAPGGGPQHWACKYSPFEDFSYQPQYYDNGQPVNKPPPEEPPPEEPPATPVEPTACPALPASGGVVDNSGACFQVLGQSQRWHVVTGEGEAGGLLWTDAVQQAEASTWARWGINLAAAGRYSVEYHAVAAYAELASTRYVVRHQGTESPLVIDQSAGGTGWRSLGTFEFDAGPGQFIAVYDNTTTAAGAGRRIVADAVRLTPATGSAPGGGLVGDPDATGSDPLLPRAGSGEEPSLLAGGCAVGHRPAAPAVWLLLLMLLGWRLRRQRPPARS